MEVGRPEDSDPNPSLLAKDDKLVCVRCGAVFEVVRTINEHHAEEVGKLSMTLPWGAMEHRCHEEKG